MRDISGRLKRYRLTRYAAPDDPVRRRLHWAWWGLALWVLWASLLSDHGFYRLWKLRQENQRAHAELQRAEQDLRRLETEMRDPTALRGLAERVLREKNGMAGPGEIVYRIQGRDSSATN